MNELIRHLRVTWRLFWSARVRWWHRAVFVLPLLYFVIPFRYDLTFDLAPLVGLVDDWLLLLLCTYVFVAVCPRPTVRRVRATVLSSDLDPQAREQARSDLSAFAPLAPLELIEAHRYPRESSALTTVIAVLILVSLLGGTMAGLAILATIGVSGLASALFQRQIRHKAEEASEEELPQIYRAMEQCWRHLPQVQVDVYVLATQTPNAFIFGLDEPHMLVLTTGLLDLLDERELAAALGHELGHVLFEHTFLSSILAGMLYRIGLMGTIWAWVFARWRRFAELTADRVSLLACRDLDVCVSMLLKIHSALPGETAIAKIIKMLEQPSAVEKPAPESRDGLELHPSLVQRIQALSDFDAELFALEVEDWLSDGTG